MEIRPTLHTAQEDYGKCKLCQLLSGTKYKGNPRFLISENNSTLPLFRTPPLWTDLVKISSRKPRHASSFSLECTDFKNVIFEKNHWISSSFYKFSFRIFVILDIEVV